jgi:hypothetical protein
MRSYGMSENKTDSVSEPVLELLAVFKEKLSSIIFPDVSLAIIEGLIGKVRTGAEKLEDVQKQVELAQQALNASSEELQQKCVKALAYAKVFAEGQDDLTERLAAINLGKPARTQKRAVSAAPATEKPVQEGTTAAPASRHKKSVAAEVEPEKTK